MLDGEISLRDGAINLDDGLNALGKDAFIARLHGEAPLGKDVNGFWVASRFEDVRAILLDHARFSSSAMGGGGRRAGVRFPLLTDDPPRHSVLRGLLAKAFTPAAMEAMRPAIEQMAHELAAAIPAGEEVDIVAAMTTPLPVAVIAGMMGVPDRAGDGLQALVRTPCWASRTIRSRPSASGTLMELRAYFAGSRPSARAAPGDDLVSALTKARRGEARR